MNKINIILWASFIILAWCMTNIEDTNNQQSNSWQTQNTQQSTWDSTQTQQVDTNTWTTKTEVSTWDTIKVDYIWTFDSGDVFDTSIEEVAKQGWVYNTWRQYSPLEFKVWAWMMIKWFDEWVVWMKLWETKKITLTPDMAYWEPNEQNIIFIPETNLWTGAVEIWQTYVFNSPSWQVQWKVLWFSGDEVQVDFNHPMAWKTLNFEITLKEIK